MAKNFASTATEITMAVVVAVAAVVTEMAVRRC